jgi:hypothetical protein
LNELFRSLSTDYGLNVKKLRAALLTEGELTDGQFLEQIEEDGLVALAKTIIDRAEEKISLESELRKLRGVEEEADMILPENLNLEETAGEGSADESLRSRVMIEESQVHGREVIAPTESRPERITNGNRTPSESPTQLLLFAYIA